MITSKHVSVSIGGVDLTHPVEGGPFRIYSKSVEEAIKHLSEANVNRLRLMPELEIDHLSLLSQKVALGLTPEINFRAYYRIPGTNKFNVGFADTLGSAITEMFKKYCDVFGVTTRAE